MVRVNIFASEERVWHFLAPQASSRPQSLTDRKVGIKKHPIIGRNLLIKQRKLPNGEMVPLIPKTERNHAITLVTFLFRCGVGLRRCCWLFKLSQMLVPILLSQHYSAQTGCIVNGEAQKSPLFWRFSGGFWLSQERLFSRSASTYSKTLNLMRTPILFNLKAL